MANELLPCPFCGGEARSYGQADSVFTSWKLCRVACLECGVGTSTYETPEAAAAAWNRRAPSTVTAAARDAALEEAALACDGYALHCDCPYPGSCAHHGVTDCARAIRALKGRA